MPEVQTKYHFLVQGAISAQQIADSIAKHQSKTEIGAHDIFLGQVRADVKDGQTVSAIDFSAYADMAEKQIEKIREEVIEKHHLTCAHVKHSLGKINAGEICFFLFVSSSHRNAAFAACHELVDRIKAKVPIFGKEIFEDESYQWKKNN